jgi:hypothetical protein
VESSVRRTSWLAETISLQDCLRDDVYHMGKHFAGMDGSESVREDAVGYEPFLDAVSLHDEDGEKANPLPRAISGEETILHKYPAGLEGAGDDLLEPGVVADLLMSS